MRKLGIFASSIAATAILAACATTAAEPPVEEAPTPVAEELTVVRVGYISNPNNVAQMFVAEQKGYFAEEGIELEIAMFSTGISLSQALTGGSVDIGVMGAAIANFPARGQGKLFLLNNLETDIHQVWAAEGSGIQSVEDLEGKTIATTTGSAGDVVLQAALDKAGLDRSQVEVVNLDMPSVANALITGAVDAASLWAPFDQQVLENAPGATLIATSGELDSPIAGGWVANNNYFYYNEDVIEGIVAAWQKANADVISDPEGSLDVVCPIIVEVMTDEVCRDIYFKTTAYSNEDWLASYGDGSALASVKRMQDVFVQIGALSGDLVQPEDYFDTSFFSKIAAR
jgi:NitT/TauT family transport system substrate-binding protein